MLINFLSLIFIWLTASSAATPDQNNTSTDVMPGNMLTTQEAPRANPRSDTTQPIIADGNPTERAATKPSANPSLRRSPTSSPTFLAGTQTEAGPTSGALPPSNSSTLGMKSTTQTQVQVTTSATILVTSHASIPTTATSVRSLLSSSTPGGAVTPPSTRPAQSTTLLSPTPTKPVQKLSTTTQPVTGGDATHSALYKTSVATTQTPFISITKAKNDQDPPENKPKSSTGATHSTAVAGLIGGALVLMLVGFLGIYIKKRKLQRRQMTTTDWAGPSPFLEGGADNGQVTLRPSNRISLSSFLPPRLSKRLSLLPETDEGSEDMTQGTTFGENHQGRTFGNDAQESKGTAVIVSEMKSTEDVPETVENSVSVTSAQTSDPLSTNHSV